MNLNLSDLQDINRFTPSPCENVDEVTVKSKDLCLFICALQSEVEALKAEVARCHSTKVKIMTDKAEGVAYELFIDQGWTDELLVKHGYLKII